VKTRTNSGYRYRGRSFLEFTFRQEIAGNFYEDVATLSDIPTHTLPPLLMDAKKETKNSPSRGIYRGGMIIYNDLSCLLGLYFPGRKNVHV
jgi:hypothetical protein